MLSIFLKIFHLRTNQIVQIHTKTAPHKIVTFSHEIRLEIQSFQQESTCSELLHKRERFSFRFCNRFKFINPNDQEFHMRAKHFHLHRFHNEFKGSVGDFGEASFDSIRSHPPCKSLSKATPPPNHKNTHRQTRG